MQRVSESFFIMRFSDLIPGHALLGKGFAKTIRGRYTVQQPGTKCARCPADQPLVHPCFLPTKGSNRILFVRALEETSGTVSSIRLRLGSFLAG